MLAAIINGPLNSFMDGPSYERKERIRACYGHKADKSVLTEFWTVRWPS